MDQNEWMREAMLLQLRLLRVIAKGVNNDHTEFQHPDGDPAGMSFHALLVAHTNFGKYDEETE